MINKKRMISLTALALILLAIGGTYAWWTTSVSTDQKISNGKMRIEADFPELQNEENYEPGLTSEITGKITNTGTIEAIARVENSSLIKFAYADDNLTPTTNSEFVQDKEGAIGLAFGPGNDQGVYWFKDSSGNAYVLFEVGGYIDTTFTAQFNGEVMGNKYQEADIKVGAKLKATQVLDDAMKAEFGVTSSDLTDYRAARRARSLGQTSVETKGQQRLKELTARK
ncbi:TasA family protein [Vagococcus sp. PNs007]|uniref:TasA family protein n=1 Tax=Vagococcus proximus TaxID=2991417 RepID=A0ABT5X2M9_9ENTE|nr:TasA family protein [Vagococcus proximus]